MGAFVRKIFGNTRKPDGFFGRLMLRGMNSGHEPLNRWALSLLDFPADGKLLDAGCGGGAAIGRLLKKCPSGFVHGLDYSAESVAMSRRVNKKYLGKRCRIVQGDVGRLPYKDGIFDGVTAFETVYFWPDLERDFREILRVLKPGGQFLIACECSDPSRTVWTSRIDGMTIYRGEDLKERLERAGFCQIEVHRAQKEWVALTAKKPF